jgi:hypothetical protein
MSGEPNPTSDAREASELALLKRRTALLARRLEAGATRHRDEVLVVVVGAARYAVRLESLSGVVALERTSRLPQAPSWIAGLSPLHGRIVTVVDLGVLLGHQGVPAPKLGLIVDVGGEVFALGVPALEGLDVDQGFGALSDPSSVPDAARPFIDGVSAHGVSRLHLPRLVEHLLAESTPGDHHG